MNQPRPNAEQEFAAADAKRAEAGTKKDYGPSF